MKIPGPLRIFSPSPPAVDEWRNRAIELNIKCRKVFSANVPTTIIHCPLSLCPFVNCPLSLIPCQLSLVHCPLSIVNCPLSIVNCQLNSQLSIRKTLPVLTLSPSNNCRIYFPEGRCSKESWVSAAPAVRWWR